LTGADVLLLEKMNRPGRKLRITGKGRGNLTNTAPLRDFLNHFGPTGKFLRPAFGQFFNHGPAGLLRLDWRGHGRGARRPRLSGQQ
jgi:predicted flavoprotein YhiN